MSVHLHQRRHQTQLTLSSKLSSSSKTIVKLAVVATEIPTHRTEQKKCHRKKIKCNGRKTKWVVWLSNTRTAIGRRLNRSRRGRAGTYSTPHTSLCVDFVVSVSVVVVVFFNTFTTAPSLIAVCTHFFLLLLIRVVTRPTPPTAGRQHSATSTLWLGWNRFPRGWNNHYSHRHRKHTRRGEKMMKVMKRRGDEQSMVHKLNVLSCCCCCTVWNSFAVRRRRRWWCTFTLSAMKKKKGKTCVQKVRCAMLVAASAAAI